jgi:hypothetical protein
MFQCLMAGSVNVGLALVCDALPTYQANALPPSLGTFLSHHRVSHPAKQRSLAVVFRVSKSRVVLRCFSIKPQSKLRSLCRNLCGLKIERIRL